MPCQRLFFALWPSSDAAKAIIAAADRMRLAGIRVAAHRLHLTLAFAGDADPVRTRELIAQAGHIRCEPFMLTLDTLGYFAGPRIAFLGLSQTPVPLAALALHLRAIVDQEADPHRCRKSSAFVPHVSVRRQAAAVDVRPLAPIEIAFSQFTLTASGDNGSPGDYRHLARWPLSRTGLPSPETGPI